MRPDLRDRWFPIAESCDLVPRHVYHGQLLKQELAVWRADSGRVNVWENRCLHRGVRLTIGTNLGTELKCQYHGWRYADGTAACTYIPAHPANAPARTIRNRTYPVLERHGLVWTRLDEAVDDAVLGDFGESGPVLRAIPIEASADFVFQRLLTHAFRAPGGAAITATRTGDLAVTMAPVSADVPLRVFLQPVDDNRCVARGVFAATIPLAPVRETLWHYDGQFEAFRDAVEQDASRDPASRSAESALVVPASLPVAIIPHAERQHTGVLIRVRVARRWTAATDIIGVSLEAAAGSLPPAVAGGHIDLHLSNGLVRQYSPINPAGPVDALVIGVKREPASRGGSAWLHDSLREGDLLAIGAPRDNFPLRRASRHLLIAGGIGLTPLLSMARTLEASGANHRLHLFARSADHVPFPDHLGPTAVRHLGLDRDGIAKRLAELLGEREADDHLYLCGPAGLIAVALGVAAQAGWPDEAVHVEHFANDRRTDRSSDFEVALARSAITVTVPSGRTIVDVLAEHDVHIPTSCSQGACGTCLVTVLDGEPDHQDVYLSRAEQASNTCMTPCVSRARSARLVLDL